MPIGCGITRNDVDIDVVLPAIRDAILHSGIADQIERRRTRDRHRAAREIRLLFSLTANIFFLYQNDGNVVDP